MLQVSAAPPFRGRPLPWCWQCAWTHAPRQPTRAMEWACQSRSLWGPRTLVLPSSGTHHLTLHAGCPASQTRNASRTGMADPSVPHFAPVWCFHPSLWISSTSLTERSLGAYSNQEEKVKGFPGGERGFWRVGKAPSIEFQLTFGFLTRGSVFGNFIIGAMNCAWILVGEITGKTVFLRGSGGGRRKVRHRTRKSY